MISPPAASPAMLAPLAARGLIYRAHERARLMWLGAMPAILRHGDAGVESFDDFMLIRAAPFRDLMIWLVSSS